MVHFDVCIVYTDTNSFSFSSQKNLFYCFNLLQVTTTTFQKRPKVGMTVVAISSPDYVMEIWG
jgi:hypothetical protein